MIPSRGFVCITAADFIVRSAYQMGKTPLLPFFAATLGAGDVLLGFIVSVSTLTGIVLKPFIGVLSDRWGRWAWILVGTAIFAFMPFVYRFIQTPEQLVVVRLVHGLATAIYGPVTLAYVVGLSRTKRAERLGWFSIARQGGYIVGPAAGGWMLLFMDPVSVFTVIGIVSSVAFLPVLLLPASTHSTSESTAPILRHVAGAMWSGSRTPAVWLAGGLNSSINTAEYAAKAFLPLYVYSFNANVAMAGAFFSVQEVVHIALNPLGGRLGDRLGHLQAVGTGMCAMGVCLMLLTIANGGPALIVPALLMGAAQALVFPSTTALVSVNVGEKNLGLGMGLLGTLNNSGKVAGPVLAGLLIHWLDFAPTFRLMAVMLAVGGALVWFNAYRLHKPALEESAMPV